MKTILFVSTRSPYPLLSGEKNKTFNEIKILSRKFDVIYCGLCARKEVSELNKMLGPFCKEIHLFETSILKSFLGLLKAFFTGDPLQIGYFYHVKLKKFCEKKSKLVDGVFVNLFRAVQYVTQIETPMYLDMSDSISEHYRKAVEVTSSSFWKRIYKYESKRMRVYEDKYLKLFRVVFLFNPNEIEIYNSKNLRWIPHGVNSKVLDFFVSREVKKNKKVSFFGKMDYRPNVDAVKWFVKNVLPLLDIEYTFQIIGAFPSKEVLELRENSRVEVTGFVEDPYSLLLESHCVVAPMISGGGIQNKLLESMAIGCVNIVTSTCANPLVGIKNELIVCDSPIDFANSVNGLDPRTEGYLRIANDARSYVRKHYTWERFEEILFNSINI